MTHSDSPDPMPTSTRATRRSRQKKRSRKLIGGLAVVIMILVGLGFWLITQEGDSPAKISRRGQLLLVVRLPR